MLCLLMRPDFRHQSKELRRLCNTKHSTCGSSNCLANLHALNRIALQKSTHKSWYLCCTLLHTSFLFFSFAPSVSFWALLLLLLFLLLFSFLFSLFSFALLVLDFCLFVVVPVRSLKSVLGLLFVLPIIHSVLEFLFSCSSDRSFIRSSDRSLLSFGFRFRSARSFPQCWTSVFTPSMLD